MNLKAVAICIMYFPVSSIIILMHLLCSMHNVTVLLLSIIIILLFHIIQIPGGYQPYSLQVGNRGQEANPHNYQRPDHTKGASR